MPRKPKGVVTRTIPDFNAANMFHLSADGTGSGATSTNTGIVLFNNTLNSTLVIWHAEFGMYNAPSGATLPTFIKGAVGVGPPGFGSNAGFTANVSLTNPQAGAVGAAYVVSSAAGTTNYSQNHAFAPQNGFWQWIHEWPLAILPPNYGFMLIGTGLASSIGFNQYTLGYWYEAVSPAPFP